METHAAKRYLAGTQALADMFDEDVLSLPEREQRKILRKIDKNPTGLHPRVLAVRDLIRRNLDKKTE